MRQVRWLIEALTKHGDQAVAPGLRGRPSNRKIAAGVEPKAIQILRAPVHKGFGPTPAAEDWANKHDSSDG